MWTIERTSDEKGYQWSQLLAQIAIPNDILLCKGKSNGSVTMSPAEQSGCADHDAALEKYYNDIKSCLHDAASIVAYLVLN